jgi:hypothetical protein
MIIANLVLEMVAKIAKSSLLKNAVLGILESLRDSKYYYEFYFSELKTYARWKG